MRLIAILALAASATASVVVRQATQAADIGRNPFQLIGRSAGANCAKVIVHGNVGQAPSNLDRFQGFGIEGALPFTQINATNQQNQSPQPCQDDNGGTMVLLSQDELSRNSGRARDFLRLDAEAFKKVFLAGMDTKARRCGPFTGSDMAYYAFTKEIDAFRARLAQLNVGLPDNLRLSGDRWMIEYLPQKDFVCVYIDTKATAYVRAVENEPGSVPGPSPGTVPPVTPPTTGTTDPAVVPPTGTDVDVESSPGPSPAADAATSSNRVCFPGSATVQLADGSVKPMSSVELGDKVMVSEGVFSDVFMFTHKMADVKYPFVNLKTNAGAELSLTAGHYLYVNGALSAAETVRVGDVVESASGDMMTVTAVSAKVMQGLYNPQTTHGDIVVDGVRASTFTTAVHPGAAQALLSPLRSLYARFGFATAALNQGSDFLASHAPSGAAIMA